MILHLMSMQKLYEMIARKLEQGIEQYARREIDIDELRLLNAYEQAFDKNWEEEKQRLRRIISTKLRKMNLDLNEAEAKLNELKAIENKEVQVDMDKMFEYGFIVGRNKRQPEGAENSQFYLPPFPQP
ncbi:hypothetical protein ECANGB1_1438 [Enterospora canceri]|uniref:Uncharacterized protein n=1 Tax=Enterospora canceri TaxID=1081671 RepID=A0A1Y1S640_9MICR|nr:hypothetical protein ECANGB1_1438 [Enterospora canceri]